MLVKQLEVLDRAIEEGEKSWGGDTTVGSVRNTLHHDSRKVYNIN